MSEQVRWTPGPWRYIGKSAIRPTNPRQPIASVLSSGRTHDERAANAHLISASPDMFAALALILPVAKAHYRFNGVDDSAFVAQAEAALAKARGQS